MYLLYIYLCYIICYKKEIETKSFNSVTLHCDFIKLLLFCLLYTSYKTAYTLIFGEQTRRLPRLVVRGHNLVCSGAWMLRNARVSARID